jgi:hypothetical protein
VAPNVITNPLNSNLYLNGNLLQNNAVSTAHINMSTTSMTINGEVGFNDNIFVQSIIGSDPNNGLIIDNTSGINENIYIRGDTMVMENTSGLSMNGKLIKNNVGDTAYIQVTPTTLIVNGNTAFNNDVVMTGEIVGSNATTGLVLETTTGGNENIYARGGGEFVIDSTLGLSMAGKPISNVNIIKSNSNDITITPLIGVTPANLNLQGNFTNIQSNFGLNMTGKFITDCATIKSNNNDLTINASTSGDTLPANIILSGNRVDISCSNGIDMLNHDITNCALLYSKNLNNAKLIRVESDFITSSLSGIYIIYGKVTMTNPFTLSGDTVLIGAGGRETCSLDWNIADPGPNYCLTNTDFNLDIINLNISNISASFDLMRCSNPSKNKIMTVSNSSFRDCENSEVIYIDGFDLVDFNQVLFQYNQVSNKHFYIDSGSKLQISSCEFLRQANRTLTSFGSAPMIEIDQTTTNWGAINISGNLIHPQQSQDGIKLGSIVPLEAVISSNTFISLGLTTGVLINYTAGNINNYPSLLVSDNSGVRNEKALLEGNVLQNTVYTPTVAGQYETVDFGPGFITPIVFRFATTANPFEFEYTGKAPISCLVTVGITADHNTGGNDTILFGISQNGTIVSEIEVSLNSGTPKSFSFNTVLLLSQGDLLVFKVLNQTAGTNSQGFRCDSFQGSLIEV